MSECLLPFVCTVVSVCSSGEESRSHISTGARARHGFYGMCCVVNVHVYICVFCSQDRLVRGLCGFGVLAKWQNIFGAH